MEALAKTPELMSLDEFLAWDSGDGRMWQLVNGEPQAMAPAKHTHGAMQAELGRLLGNHLAEHKPSCSVIVAPGVVPRVQSKANCRIPDLAVTSSSYIDEEATLSNPVLLIEIVSQSNRVETWSKVWTYTTIASVTEILIFKSESIGGDVLRRSADGSWPEKPEPVTEGELYLSSIDFRVSVAAIYRTTRLARAG
jgi:Uma2 family endonuclease